MIQEAPDPAELIELVDQCEYKEWSVRLVDLERSQGCSGLTLIITAEVQDSYHDREINIAHLFPVPPATYDRRSWQRWLLDQVLLVERHEACEFFKIDGERPYAPHHGPGNDPYIIFEHGSDEDVRTLNTGKVKSEV
jgi:hypothetical protein